MFVKEIHKQLSQVNMNQQIEDFFYHSIAYIGFRMRAIVLPLLMRQQTL